MARVLQADVERFRDKSREAWLKQRALLAEIRVAGRAMLGARALLVGALRQEADADGVPVAVAVVRAGLADVVLRQLETAIGETGQALPEPLTLDLDGDQWCVLYGENLQEGISGFGPTPDEAVLAFAEAVLEASAPEGQNPDAATLARVYDLAIPSLNPDTFIALEGALQQLAANRRIPWAPAPAAPLTQEDTLTEILAGRT